MGAQPNKPSGDEGENIRDKSWFKKGVAKSTQPPEDLSRNPLRGPQLNVEGQRRAEKKSGKVDSVTEGVRQKIGGIDTAEWDEAHQRGAELNEAYQKGAEAVQNLSDAEKSALANIRVGDVIFFNDPKFPGVEWEVMEMKDGVVYFKESQEVDGQYEEHPNPIRIPRAELPEYFKKYKSFKIKAIGGTKESAEEEADDVTVTRESGIVYTGEDEADQKAG